MIKRMPESISKPGWLKIWHSAAFACRFCGTLALFSLELQTAKHLSRIISNKQNFTNHRKKTFVKFAQIRVFLFA
jgi:hypothetical protein